MNRAQVLASFTVDEKSGIIKSPGKFEGEMLYVPALWNGDSDPVVGSVCGTIFDANDRAEFPEIGETYGILMEESEQGFVSASEFDTREEYEAAITRAERADDGNEYELG